MYLFSRFPFGLLPGFTAQPVQWCQFFLRASVTGYEVQRGDRDIQGRIILVNEGQKLCLLAVNGKHLQAPVATDTMIYVDHRCAHIKFCQALDSEFGEVFTFPVAAAFLQDTFTE